MREDSPVLCKSDFNKNISFRYTFETESIDHVCTVRFTPPFLCFVIQLFIKVKGGNKIKPS